MASQGPLNVLIVDDDSHVLDVYQRMVSAIAGFSATASNRPARALEAAQRQLFDALVIDAKLDYRGEGFGGFRLAEDLRARYGANSILIISQYITKDLMEECGSHFEFLDKGSVPSPKAFVKLVCNRLKEMRKRQHVFVAMPFASDYTRVYTEGIKPAIESVGFRCVRADEIAHTRPIHEVMFDTLATSKLVVFLAEGANPNAYYEAGFADALQKEVVIVASSLESLKFDVKHRHTIQYEGELRVLRSELRKKLLALRRLGG